MKILFVYFNKDFRPRTSLTISLLETIIKEDGHETKIFDTSFYPRFSSDYERMTKAGIYRAVQNLEIYPKLSDPIFDLKNTILDFAPDLLAFTYYSFNEDIQSAMLVPIKECFPNLKIISGGPAVCMNPKKCLGEPYIDMICFGEGEICFKELCNKMRDGANINDIKGIWIKNRKDLICNGISPLADLNSLPIQNWDSFDKIHINGFFNGMAYRMGHVEFIRGCPYNCTYCGSGSIKKPYFDAGIKKYVRYKDPIIAVNEYKTLKEKYNLEMFYFVAGTFTAIPTNVLEELSYYYKRDVGLPFFALVRPETIRENTAKLLGEMGCVHVSIGVESGIRKYREDVLNRKMSDQQIIDSIKYLKNNGIRVSAYNMIGLPGMDRRHIFNTIELTKKAKPSDSILSIFMPFDNEFTQSLINKGLLDKNNIKISNGTEPTVGIKEMRKEEIIGLYNTFNLYLKVPNFMYWFIRLLEGDGYMAKISRRLLYWIIKKARRG